MLSFSVGFAGFLGFEVFEVEGNEWTSGEKLTAITPRRQVARAWTPCSRKKRSCRN